MQFRPIVLNQEYLPINNWLCVYCSHFEATADDEEDRDTKNLRSSLQRVSGNCRELATPMYIDQVNLDFSAFQSPLNVNSQNQTIGELSSSTYQGRSSGQRFVICEDIPTPDSARLPWQSQNMKFFYFVMDLSQVCSICSMTTSLNSASLRWSSNHFLLPESTEFPSCSWHLSSSRDSYLWEFLSPDYGRRIRVLGSWRDFPSALLCFEIFSENSEVKIFSLFQYIDISLKCSYWETWRRDRKWKNRRETAGRIFWWRLDWNFPILFLGHVGVSRNFKSSPSHSIHVNVLCVLVDCNILGGV